MGPARINTNVDAKGKRCLLAAHTTFIAVDFNSVGRV